MNPVNATSLYLSACRSVLQCDPGDPRALTELCNLLPFFRQSLSCLVCGNLLQDPIAPTNSSCQHYVCRECKGQRMQLKPSCSWCKDYSCFQENRQLSVLVHCYRKLCLYIAQSPLAPHLSSAATDLPDLQAVLNEGVSLAEQEVERRDLSDSGNQSLSASTSDVQPDEAPPTQDSKGEGLRPVALNGTHDCNGLAISDTLQSITIETEQVVLKSESFEEELPVCVSVTGTGEAGLCDISTFGDDVKHEGGSLLLSVEEVLRTLDTSSEPDATPLQDSPSSVPLSSLNGPCHPTSSDSSRLTPSLPQDDNPGPLQPHSQPSTVIPQPSMVVSQPSDVIPQPPAVTPVPCVPTRYHRKRSRSESDREKVQPLPIGSILQAPPLGANVTPHHPNSSATIKRDPKLASSVPNTHLAPVPNGGPPKVGKTVLVSSKGLKKTLEHHSVPKKVYTKVRQGVPKPRAQPRDRLPAHPHSHPLSHPPSPSKPLYKKPVEKKGCKCGRATQNPSVLTCRGQRCPCYSNRKACLDCICRGCQNSYMANGEKKLEAFAVPEKALEQTRLTLGINLTSITAAALRSPATSSPGNTLINVTAATGAPVTAAFLSGAGHDNRAFDDSLEMRFDC